MPAKTKAPARPKAPPKAPARVRYVGGRPAGAPPAASRRQVTPGQAARAPGKAARKVTERKGKYTAAHMLTAELIAGVLITAVRAVADYEPQADGTLRGKVGHPKGQYGPLPVLAGLIVTFFLLSFLAASGGLKGKLAVIAGAIVDLGLLLNSGPEFAKVSGTFAHFGKARIPPGQWQTEGTATIFGDPVSGTLGGTGGSTMPNLNPKGKGAMVTPPPGSIAVPPGGCPSNYLEEGDPKTGARWCAPIMG